MKKVEIIEFNAGAEVKYAIRRTSGIFSKTIEFMDLSNAVWRKQHAGDRDCFLHDLNSVRHTFMRYGFAEGIPINDNNTIKINEISAMNLLAEKDEGMKDLLLKAKEFYYLKKK